MSRGDTSMGPLAFSRKYSSTFKTVMFLASLLCGVSRVFDGNCMKKLLPKTRVEPAITKRNEAWKCTSRHHACGHRLNPIASRKAGPPVRAIRGLCWCNTCTKFVSRDGNAARNILRVFKTDVRRQDRPHDLRYGQRRQVTQTLLKLP